MVVPLGHGAGVGDGHHGEGGEAVFGDEVLAGGEGALVAGEHPAVEHQGGLLRQGHPGQEVLDALLDGQPRVLVGLHGAVVVEVAERRAVGVAQRLRAARGAHAVTPAAALARKAATVPASTPQWARKPSVPP